MLYTLLAQNMEAQMPQEVWMCKLASFRRANEGNLLFCLQLFHIQHVHSLGGIMGNIVCAFSTSDALSQHSQPDVSDRDQ